MSLVGDKNKNKSFQLFFDRKAKLKVKKIEICENQGLSKPGYLSGRR